MFKICLKNFFYSLRFLYIPILCIISTLILGVLIVLPSFVIKTNNIKSDLNQILEVTGESISDLSNNILDAFKNININNQFELYDLLTSDKWLVNTIKSEVSSSTENVLINYNNFLIRIVHVIIWFLLIGIIIGFYLTKRVIKKKVAKLTFKKKILGILLNLLFSITIIAFIKYLYYVFLYRTTFLISFFFILVSYGLINLFQSYLIFKKNLTFKEVVNFKNVIGLLLAGFTIILFLVLLLFILLNIFNSIIALFIFIPVCEIGFIVLGLNAYIYCQMIQVKSIKGL